MSEDFDKAQKQQIDKNIIEWINALSGLGMLK